MLVIVNLKKTENVTTRASVSRVEIAVRPFIVSTGQATVESNPDIRHTAYHTNENLLYRVVQKSLLFSCICIFINCCRKNETMQHLKKRYSQHIRRTL